MKRQPLSLRVTLWLTVSLLTLIIFLLAGQEALMQWRQLHKVGMLQKATVISDKLFDATDRLSDERDIAYTLLHAPATADVSDLQSRLKDSRRDTDASFAAALTAMNPYAFPEISGLRHTVEVDLTAIKSLRPEIDRTERQPLLASRWYDKTTELIADTENLWLKFIQHFTDIDPIVTQHLRYKHFLLIISDYMAQERALASALLVENANPTPRETMQCLRWQGALELSWKAARLLAEQSGLYDKVGPYFKDAESSYQTMQDMAVGLFVPGGRRDATYPIGAGLWLELSDAAADSLSALKNESWKAKHAYLDMLERQGKKAIALRLGVLALALVLCGACFHIIGNRVLKSIDSMILALMDAMHGKAVSFVPQARQQDEIGKLAEVLHAFQQNAEAIRHNAITLENYTHALERSNKELDDFAYIASHDLKEPLRGIHNHSRFLLEDNQGKLDPESNDRLGRLVYLSQRMERLVNDLLYFSRLGRQEMAIQSTDINEVIHDIDGTLELFLKERGARIAVPKQLPTVTCDKTRISEVFRNFITNAVKYNDKPEKVVEIGFLPECIAPDGTMASQVFYVRDNGKGIEKEFYSDIFRIFKRLQKAEDSPEEGTGVGLTFVKKIIERHGGKIWLESAVGRGTVFYFTLGGQSYGIQKAA